MTERGGLAKAVFSITQNDTEPTIRATLYWGDGTVIDLTGGAVNFLMKSMNSGLTVINAPATILGPGTSGRVEYSWIPADTKEAGWMAINWKVALVAPLGGTTVPNFGHDDLLITKAIV